MNSNQANFAKAVRQVFRVLLAEELHTCLPGKVESYDPITRKATVKPLLKKKYLDDTELELEPITDVPIIFFGAGDSGLRLPESQVINQTCLLIFSERSLDNWLLNGELTIPAVNTKFDLTDAIAIVGLNSFNNTDTDGGNDLVLFYGNNKITLKEENGNIEIEGGNKIIVKANGDIEIGTSALRSLISDDLITIYNSHVHTGVTAGGVSSGPPAVALTSAVATQKTKAQ